MVESDDKDIEYYIKRSLIDINNQKSKNKQYSKTINSILTYYSKLDNNYLDIINRMTKIGDLFAKQIKLNYGEQYKLHNLILCCEIGMIGLPSHLVLKSNPNVEELNILQEHTLRGYKISFSDPQLKEIADEILYHHENYDGSGYLYGLKGEEIPYVARVLRIIYDFDYLINNDGLTFDETLESIKENSGIIYDPKLVRAFIKVTNKNKEEILEYFL